MYSVSCLDEIFISNILELSVWNSFVNKNIAIIDSAGIPAIYDRFKTLAEYPGKKSGLTMYCTSKSYNESIEYNN